jgi:O-antigen/teichoic acid export membrane protein
MMIKNLSLFVVSDIINKSIPFILIPILTRYLVPDEYAIVSLFSLTIALFTIFVGNGMHSALTVNYFKHQVNIKLYLNSILLISILITIFFFILLMLTSGYVEDYFNLSIFWIILALIVSLFQFITSLNLVLFVVKREAANYGVYQISQSLLNFCIVVVLVVYFNLSWQGVLVGVTASSVVFGFLSIYLLYKRNFIDSDNLYRVKYIKKILSFSLPLILHYVFGWLKVSADKLIILNLISLSLVGVYTVGYQLSSIVLIITMSINKVWSPFILKKLNNGFPLSEKIKVVKIMYLSWISIGLVSIVIYYVIYSLIDVITTVEYLESLSVIPYLILGFFFQGMYYFLVSFLAHLEKSKLISTITIISTLVHIALSLWMVRDHGIIGLGYATSISFGIMVIITWFYLNKFYTMPWFLNKNTSKVF